MGIMEEFNRRSWDDLSGDEIREKVVRVLGKMTSFPRLERDNLFESVANNVKLPVFVQGMVPTLTAEELSDLGLSGPEVDVLSSVGFIANSNSKNPFTHGIDPVDLTPAPLRDVSPPLGSLTTVEEEDETQPDEQARLVGVGGEAVPPDLTPGSSQTDARFKRMIESIKKLEKKITRNALKGFFDKMKRSNLDTMTSPKVGVEAGDILPSLLDAGYRDSIRTKMDGPAMNMKIKVLSKVTGYTGVFFISVYDIMDNSFIMVSPTVSITIDSGGVIRLSSIKLDPQLKPISLGAIVASALLRGELRAGSALDYLTLDNRRTIYQGLVTICKDLSNAEAGRFRFLMNDPHIIAFNWKSIHSLYAHMNLDRDLFNSSLLVRDHPHLSLRFSDVMIMIDYHLKNTDTFFYTDLLCSSTSFRELLNKSSATILNCELLFNAIPLSLIPFFKTPIQGVGVVNVVKYIDPSLFDIANDSTDQFSTPHYEVTRKLCSGFPRIVEFCDFMLSKDPDMVSASQALSVDLFILFLGIRSLIGNPPGTTPVNFFPHDDLSSDYRRFGDMTDETFYHTIFTDLASPITLSQYAYVNTAGKRISLSLAEVVAKRKAGKMSELRKYTDARSMGAVNRVIRKVMIPPTGVIACYFEYLYNNYKDGIQVNNQRLQVSRMNGNPLHESVDGQAAVYYSQGDFRNHGSALARNFSISDLTHSQISRMVDSEGKPWPIIPYTNSRTFGVYPVRASVSTALSRISNLGNLGMEFSQMALQQAGEFVASSGFSPVSLFHRAQVQVNTPEALIRQYVKEYPDVTVDYSSLNNFNVLKSDSREIAGINKIPANWFSFLFGSSFLRDNPIGEGEVIMDGFDSWEQLADLFFNFSSGPSSSSAGYFLGGLRRDRSADEIAITRAFMKDLSTVVEMYEIRLNLSKKFLSMLPAAPILRKTLNIQETGKDYLYPSEFSLDQIEKFRKPYIMLLIPVMLYRVLSHGLLDKTISTIRIVSCLLSNGYTLIHLHSDSNSVKCLPEGLSVINMVFFKDDLVLLRNLLFPEVQEGVGPPVVKKVKVPGKAETALLRMAKAHSPISTCVNKLEVYEKSKVMAPTLDPKSKEFEDKVLFMTKKFVQSSIPVTELPQSSVSHDTSSASCRIVCSTNYFTMWPGAMLRDLSKASVLRGPTAFLPLDTGDIYEMASDYNDKILKGQELVAEFYNRDDPVVPFPGLFKLKSGYSKPVGSIKIVKVKPVHQVLLTNSSDNLYAVFSGGTHCSFDLSKSESGANSRDADSVVDSLLTSLVMNISKRSKESALFSMQFLESASYYLNHYAKRSMYHISAILGDLLLSYPSLSSGHFATYQVNNTRSALMVFYHYYVESIFTVEFIDYMNSAGLRGFLIANKNQNVVEITADSLMSGIRTYDGRTIQVLTSGAADLCAQTCMAWKLEKTTLVNLDISNPAEKYLSMDTDLLGFSITSVGSFSIPSLDENRAFKSLLFSKDESISGRLVLYGTDFYNSPVSHDLPIEVKSGKLLADLIKKGKVIVPEKSTRLVDVELVSLFVDQVTSKADEGPYESNSDEVESYYKTSQKGQGSEKNAKPKFKDNINACVFQGHLLSIGFKSILGSPTGSKFSITMQMAYTVSNVIDIVKYYGLVYLLVAKPMFTLFCRYMMDSILMNIMGSDKAVVDELLALDVVRDNLTNGDESSETTKSMARAVFQMIPLGIRTGVSPIPQISRILDSLKSTKRVLAASVTISNSMEYLVNNLYYESDEIRQLDKGFVSNDDRINEVMVSLLDFYYLAEDEKRQIRRSSNLLESLGPREYTVFTGSVNLEINKNPKSVQALPEVWIASFVDNVMSSEEAFDKFLTYELFEMKSRLRYAVIRTSNSVSLEDLVLIPERSSGITFQKRIPNIVFVPAIVGGVHGLYRVNIGAIGDGDRMKAISSLNNGVVPAQAEEVTVSHVYDILLRVLEALKKPATQSFTNPYVYFLNCMYLLFPYLRYFKFYSSNVKSHKDLVTDRAFIKCAMPMGLAKTMLIAINSPMFFAEDVTHPATIGKILTDVMLAPSSNFLNYFTNGPIFVLDTVLVLPASLQKEATKKPRSVDKDRNVLDIGITAGEAKRLSSVQIDRLVERSKNKVRNRVRGKFMEE